MVVVVADFVVVGVVWLTSSLPIVPFRCSSREDTFVQSDVKLLHVAQVLHEVSLHDGVVIVFSSSSWSSSLLLLLVA